MLTSDKQITTAEYWNKVYTGANKDAKVDASNTRRPVNSFDRFSWVAQYAEGDLVLGVGSGHAHIEKRIREKHPDWGILATDQAARAISVANFNPYLIFDAYQLPTPKQIFADEIGDKWNTVIIAQAMEYLERPEAFMKEAARVAEKIIITLPIGEMSKWSQLRIYTEENVREFLEPFGKIEIFDRQGDILLVKLNLTKKPD